MARPLRIEYPGAFYHVFQHGLGQIKIFDNSRDNDKFFEYLELVNKKYCAKIHSYCLMDNHYHLIVETPNANLNRVMHTINVGYSVYYNRKRQRKGPLFRGRYKAVVIDIESYLHYLSAYIHLNPVKALIAKTPFDYESSSFKYFVNKRETPKWLEVNFILSLFGETESNARKSYTVFVNEVKDYVDQKIKNNTCGPIVGDSDFVEYVKNEYLTDLDDENLPELKALRKNHIDYDMIRNIVRDLHVNNNLKRNLRMYLAKEHTGYTLAQIGENEGGLKYAAVCMQIKRFRQKFFTHGQLAKSVEKLEKLLNVKT
ncbi:MAG: transposase [Candidatus Theseobacter exili]|nr:transposase [Candidatus Theseobacter exili]